jgi:hypothetical protein
MNDDLMNELTTIPSLVAPTVDDRLIWESWTSMSQRRLANIGHFSHTGAPFFLFERARQKWEVPPMSEWMRAGILIIRGK